MEKIWKKFGKNLESVLKRVQKEFEHNLGRIWEEFGKRLKRIWNKLEKIWKLWLLGLKTNISKYEVEYFWNYNGNFREISWKFPRMGFFWFRCNQFIIFFVNLIIQNYKHEFC